MAKYQGIYLGIDVGTEGVRVALFDEHGTPRALESRRYRTHWPRPAWAEQNPEDWWNSLQQCVRAVLCQADLSGADIRGIGIDTTACTVVCLDKKMKPLRPALLWMDVRASDQAQRISLSGDKALKFNGYGAVSAEWMPCKALWLKENEPSVYQSSAVVCECVDYLTYLLTGRLIGSLNTCTARWYYDKDLGGFPGSLYEAVGLGDLLAKFPRDVLPMGTLVEGLSAAAADALGLQKGIPVAAGGADAFVGMLGLGAIEPGRIALITGSSHLQLALSEKPLHTKGLWGGFPDAVIPGLYMIEGGQTSTGSIVQWFHDKFSLEEQITPNEQCSDFYERINKRAMELEAGSEGLIVLDFWQGNRTPYTDPKARGLIWGLSLAHESHHVYRAILEGIAYGTENVLQTMREAGIDVKELYVAGGPTHSDLWMQIHADVSNAPINLMKVADAPALGSAILGSVAAGDFNNVHESVQAMVHIDRRIEPHQSSHDQYRYYFEIYKKTYEQMRDVMHDMADHERDRTNLIT